MLRYRVVNEVDECCSVSKTVPFEAQNFEDGEVASRKLGRAYDVTLGSTSLTRALGKLSEKWWPYRSEVGLVMIKR